MMCVLLFFLLDFFSVKEVVSLLCFRFCFSLSVFFQKTFLLFLCVTNFEKEKAIGNWKIILFKKLLR